MLEAQRLLRRSAQRAALALVQAQQQRIVLGVDGVVGLVLELAIGAHARVDLGGLPRLVVVVAAHVVLLARRRHGRLPAEVLGLRLLFAEAALLRAILGGDLALLLAVGLGRPALVLLVGARVRDDPAGAPLGAPAHRRREVRVAEATGGPTVRSAAQRREVGDDLGPVPHHVAGAAHQRIDGALQVHLHARRKVRRGDAVEVTLAANPQPEAGEPAREGVAGQPLPRRQQGFLHAVDTGCFAKRVEGALLLGGHALVDEVEHHRVLLHARDEARRVVAGRVGNLREVLLALAMHPLGVRRDVHALDAEPRQHAHDVRRQRAVEDHHHHVVRREALGIVEREVRHAVQPDGRLAGAGAALDHREARRRARDELELPRVDERGDLREVLVLAPLDADAELAAGLRRLATLVLGGRSHRRELAALELRRVHRGPRPALLGAEVHALRRHDALELAAADDHRAAHGHHALEGLAAELLLVVVALLVAVVDPRDRGVAPVDDAHAALGVDEGAVADEHISRTPALDEAHVPEIRAREVRLADGHLGATGGDAAQALHLRHQRRKVLGARVADEVAQLEHLGVVVDPVGHRHRLEVLGDAAEELLLLADDGAQFAVRGRLGIVGVCHRGRRSYPPSPSAATATPRAALADALARSDASRSVPRYGSRVPITWSNHGQVTHQFACWFGPMWWS